MTPATQTHSALAQHWTLDPEVAFLNHGSFGACPRVILEKQAALRAQLERQPVQFFVREYEGMLDEARDKVGAFIGAKGKDLAPVHNATGGVNTVLRSLDLQPGDELLVSNHEYNACRNALDFVAGRAGAKVVPVEIPFPITGSGEIVERFMAAFTDRTRLLLVDGITSITALVQPFGELVRLMRERGVETLIDGAHTLGHIDLDLDGLGAGYFTGNAHKWFCAPKGAALLWVRPDLQSSVRPLTISHGANSPRNDISMFSIEFGWQGTDDPTAFLCVPDCIDFLGGLFPGGWPELMQHNRDLARYGRDKLCEALGVPHPAPDEMLGNMAAVPLPDSTGEPSTNPLYLDPLQDQLLEQYGIEVPIAMWPEWPKRIVRISAQAYNHPAQYDRLATALTELL